MKRILVIGSCGAGKSTLSKRLSKKLNIKLIHLDQHYWKAGWKRTKRDSFRKRVENLLKKDSWIIDGNYRNTMDIRISKSDTIIFLDFSRLVCLYRIFKRRFKENRVDFIKGCPEKIDLELVKWVLWDFPQTSRKDILNKIKKVKNNKNVFILKTNKQIDSFFSSIG